MDIKKVAKYNGKRISSSKNTSDLENDKKSEIAPCKNKAGLSQGLSNGKKLSSNRKFSNKSSTELSNEVIESKSESSKQIIENCDGVETRGSKYKHIRKGINKDDKASASTSSDSKNVKTCIALRKGEENGKLSEKNKRMKSNKTTPTNSDYKNIKTDRELRKDKLSGKKEINKEDETTLPTNSNSKNFRTRIKLEKNKVKNKLSERKESCKDDDISSLTNSDSKSSKTTSLELGKDKVKRELAKNLSFDDIEKKIYEDILIPVKEKTSNHKSKLNKNKFLNEQLNTPTCSKNNEKQKSKRISKTLQNDSSLKKLNKKVAGKNNSKVKRSKTKKVESSSDESDWEDVDELNEILSGKDKKPNNNIQIELKAENPLWGITKRKRRSEREKIEDYLRKEINKSIREVYENMHKTHLLCLLAHGMYVNSVLRSETLISCALSIIPKQYYSPKRLDINHLEKFVNWFYSHMKIKTITDQKSLEIPETSISETKTIKDVLIKRFEDKSPACFKEVVLMFVATSRAVGMTVRYVQSLTPISWKPPAANLLKPKKESDETNETFGSSKPEKLEKTIKKKSMKMLSSDSEIEPDDKDIKQKRKKKKTNNKDSSEDSEVNFDLVTNFRKKGIKASNKKHSKTKENKNNESDNCNISKKGEIKDWAEVYVEEEEKWIPIDVTRNQIHCASEIESRTLNLAYVIAFNPDNTVKDVTKRYMSSWLSYNNKVRLDNEWWSDSLKPFLSLSDKRDKEEDREMDEVLKLQPLPKTINEYKNHPLYALQRHLLKFEALYPPDASPVGFIRGEPVYPRECVKNLGGRDRWIKEAKTVRVNEEPYKIVKAHPKWDRNTCQLIKDKPLELFGEWQVEDYEPPIAKNGRVPRNEYGNVDLFKMCMLPRGCVHLPINGLNRVARKINIDCAPAVTGFDYHSGFCHAVHDGFVVCEEFKDILLDAWNQDKIEQAKKEEEKKLKRIYDNWKRLINGVTLKERLQEKYGIINSQDTSLTENHSKKKEPVKKIKQKDLNELPSSVITHSISNFRIDFEKSATDGMKKKRPVKRKLVSNKNKSCIKNTDSLDKSSLHSSDSEDLSDTEKRKKIRSILDWNPNAIGNQSDPALSDESGEETNIGESRLKNSSLMLSPISESQSVKNSSSAIKSIKSSKKSSVTTGGVKFLSSSESEEVPNSPPLKRRSLRAIKSKQNYKEGDGTPSDISVEDSDTGDATYHPISE